MFAPTPPFEPLRMVLSHATTRVPNEPQKIWDGETGQADDLFHGHLKGVLQRQGRRVGPGVCRAPAQDRCAARKLRTPTPPHVRYSSGCRWLAVRVQRIAHRARVHPGYVIGFVCYAMTGGRLWSASTATTSCAREHDCNSSGWRLSFARSMSPSTLDWGAALDGWPVTGSWS